MQPQHIVVGISGRQDEDHKIAYACTYATAFQAELRFLHINDPKAGTGSLAFVDHGARFDERMLERYVHTHGPNQLPARCAYSVQTGDYLEQLITISHQADLLILGHHHHSWLASLLCDTADEQVINRAQCPVLVIGEP